MRPLAGCNTNRQNGQNPAQYQSLGIEIISDIKLMVIIRLYCVVCRVSLLRYRVQIGHVRIFVIVLV